MPKFKKSSGFKMKGWSGYVSPAKDIQDGGYDHHENNDPNSPHVTKGDVQPTPTPTDPGTSPLDHGVGPNKDNYRHDAMKDPKSGRYHDHKMFPWGQEKKKKKVKKPPTKHKIKYEHKHNKADTAYKTTNRPGEQVTVLTDPQKGMSKRKNPPTKHKLTKSTGLDWQKKGKSIEHTHPKGPGTYEVKKKDKKTGRIGRERHRTN